MSSTYAALDRLTSTARERQVADLLGTFTSKVLYGHRLRQ